MWPVSNYTSAALAALTLGAVTPTRAPVRRALSPGYTPPRRRHFVGLGSTRAPKRKWTNKQRYRHLARYRRMSEDQRNEQRQMRQYRFNHPNGRH